MNNAENYEKALSILREMENSDIIKPDEISYSTLINKSKTYEQAI